MFGKTIRRFLRWNVLRPAQILFRGWSYSDIANLYSHLAKTVHRRLKAYLKGYSNGSFAGAYPGKVLAEFKDQLIAEGYPWEESRWSFQAESGADERLHQIWLGILESMLFSFEWVVLGEPIPEDCRKPNPLYDPKAKTFLPSDDGKRSTLNPAAREFEIDDDKYQEFGVRVQKGFDLFGKYYLCLWD